MMKILKVFNYHTLAVVFFLSMVLYLLSCETEYDTGSFFEEESTSIAEYIETRQDSFSIFYQLIEKGELKTTLKAYNPNGNNYTLFLFSDRTFESFISRNQKFDSYSDLINDEDYLKTIVRYHTVNMAIERSDFPFGALPDTTLTGDLLTVSYKEAEDSTVALINNEAVVISQDIKTSNGYIHIIDKVLEPVVSSSYEKLLNQPRYSMFTKALEITGLKDTFRIEDELSEVTYRSNTLFVESDEIFNSKGISSIEDLKNRYSPDNSDYSNYSNGLYQFMAYHILEGKKFLNNFEGINTNYNTYANLPVSVNALGIDIKINPGVAKFDTVISENDTSVIDYVGLFYDQSNVITKNGAIHFIDQIMDLYQPPQNTIFIDFYEEPLIDAAEKSPGNYIFDEDDKQNFRYLKWHGVDEILYVKISGGVVGISNDDYLELEGNFTISYEIPKILPGRYQLQIRANDEDKNNATIMVYFDGKKIGGSLDLTTNPNQGSTMNNFTAGQVKITNYRSHTIEIQNLIPGKFILDRIIFEPIGN